METLDDLAALERDWKDREREYHADRTSDRERAMLAAWRRWDAARATENEGEGAE